MRLIDADALKANMKKAEEQADTFEMLVEFYKQIIDNAPTVLFPLTVKIKDDLTDEDIETLKRLMKDCKPQVLTLETERTQDEWIRLDLAKRVIAKFKGYLDEDMIGRIQFALEKENEAEMKGGAENE